MEWVEVTGRTVEEAKDAALDQLGVDESEAEFEVLAEPRAGLFGRLRSEARVRARVQPTAVRPKVDRGARRRGRKDRPGSDDGGGAGPSDAAAASPADEEQPRAAAPSRSVGRSGAGRGGGGGAAGVGSGADGASEPSAAVRSGAGEAPAPSSNGGTRASTSARATRPEKRAKSAVDKGESVDQAQEPGGDPGELGEQFLQGLVSAFGVDGTVARRELDDGDTIELAVEGKDVGMLIGPRGQTLSALQELTRTVVQRKVGDNQPRLVVDVAGYRKDRREALERFTRDVAAQVLASGSERVLEPMPAADRKVVHDTVNTIDGVSTTSEGEEPRRRVVLIPDAQGD